MYITLPWPHSAHGCQTRRDCLLWHTRAPARAAVALLVSRAGRREAASQPASQQRGPARSTRRCRRHPTSVQPGGRATDRASEGRFAPSVWLLLVYVSSFYFPPPPQQQQQQQQQRVSAAWDSHESAGNGPKKAGRQAGRQTGRHRPKTKQARQTRKQTQQPDKNGQPADSTLGQTRPSPLAYLTCLYLPSWRALTSAVPAWAAVRRTAVLSCAGAIARDRARPRFCPRLRAREAPLAGGRVGGRRGGEQVPASQARPSQGTADGTHTLAHTRAAAPLSPWRLHHTWSGAVLCCAVLCCAVRVQRCSGAAVPVSSSQQPLPTSLASERHTRSLPPPPPPSSPHTLTDERAEKLLPPSSLLAACAVREIHAWPAPAGKPTDATRVSASQRAPASQPTARHRQTSDRCAALPACLPPDAPLVNLENQPRTCRLQH